MFLKTSRYACLSHRWNEYTRREKEFLQEYFYKDYLFPMSNESLLHELLDFIYNGYFFKDLKRINELLLEIGKDLNTDEIFIQGETRTTLLHIFACHPQIDYKLLLYDKEINYNVLNEYNETPLQVACRFSNEKAIESLLIHGAEVNTTNDNKTSPLSELCDSHIPLIGSIKNLLDHGANINWVNRMGQNALHLACYHNNIETVRILIENGCDYRRIDKNGMIPLDWLINDKETQEILQLIERIECR